VYLKSLQKRERRMGLPSLLPAEVPAMSLAVRRQRGVTAAVQA